MSSSSTFDYEEFHYTVLSSKTCMIGINSENSNAPIIGGSFSGVLKIPNFAYDSFRNKYEVVETSIKSFKYCENLTSALLPKNLKKINQDTFYGTGISSLKIPRSVEILDYAAFSGMSKLREIEFEPGSMLSKLGTDVFHRCDEIRKVVLPLHVSYIAGNMFSYISSSENIDVYYCGSNIISESIFGRDAITAYVTNRYPTNAAFGGKTPSIINDNTCKEFIDYELRRGNFTCRRLKHSNGINLFILSAIIWLLC